MINALGGLARLPCNCLARGADHGSLAYSWRGKGEKRGGGGGKRDLLVFIRERGVTLDVAEHAVARAEGGQRLLLDGALHLDGLREDVRRIVYAACQHQLSYHLRNSHICGMGGERKTHVTVYTSFVPIGTIFVPNHLCSPSLSLSRARALSLALSLSRSLSSVYSNACHALSDMCEPLPSQVTCACCCCGWR